MAFISQSALIALAAFAIFVAIGASAILVLWIVTPFSVFGTKELLKKSIAEQEKTNRLLRSLLEADLSRTEALKPRDGIESGREQTH